jgi:hypothetical protein
VFAGLLMVGSGALFFAVQASAHGLSPGNGGLDSFVQPPSALPSDAVSLSDNNSNFDKLNQTLGLSGGRLDFFSLRPDADFGFTPELHGGVSRGGLQLQLNW